MKSPRPRAWRYVLVAASLLVVGAVMVFTFGDEVAGRIGLVGVADTDLEAAVHEAFEKADSTDTVVLADVTDFGWDAVGVFTPYYSHDHIVEEMGVEVPRTVTNHLQHDESHCLLVFRDEGRVAGWTTVDRTVADCAFEATGLYSREQARFRGDALYRREFEPTLRPPPTE